MPSSPDLVLITHGRCASTLLVRWLYETGEFHYWGVPPQGENILGHAKYLRWNADTVADAWQQAPKQTPLLSKSPTFGYIMDLLLPLTPHVIVVERNVVDKIRSILAVGWGELEVHLARARGFLQNAYQQYSELGGEVPHELQFSLFVSLALTFSYAHWKTRRDLAEYPHALFLQFDELMFNDVDALEKIQQFLNLKSSYQPLWNKLKQTKVQATWRTNHDFTTPLPIPIPDHDMQQVADIVERFHSAA